VDNPSTPSKHVHKQLRLHTQHKRLSFSKKSTDLENPSTPEKRLSLHDGEKRLTLPNPIKLLSFSWKYTKATSSTTRRGRRAKQRALSKNSAVAESSPSPSPYFYKRLSHFNRATKRLSLPNHTYKRLTVPNRIQKRLSLPHRFTPKIFLDESANAKRPATRRARRAERALFKDSAGVGRSPSPPPYIYKHKVFPNKSTKAKMPTSVQSRLAKKQALSNDSPGLGSSPTPSPYVYRRVFLRRRIRRHHAFSWKFPADTQNPPTRQEHGPERFSLPELVVGERAPSGAPAEKARRARPQGYRENRLSLPHRGPRRGAVPPMHLGSRLA
jgi:hypothetical protein